MKLILILWAVLFVILFIVCKTVKGPSIQYYDQVDSVEVLEGGDIDKGKEQDSLDSLYPPIPVDTLSFHH